MKLLDEIVALSHEFGTSDYVKGGGGNTSAKTTDTLWVKPSGTTLAGMTPDSFVAMNRHAMRQLYLLDVPADPQMREAMVKDVMATAVLPSYSGRPSVEAPLHELLSGVFVVHTHPALVNGMTCSMHGREACARLFPDALWIPYIDPGYTLCMDVRERVKDFAAQNGKPPVLLFLENHGVFVAGNTADEIRGSYKRVMETLQAEYQRLGVATTLKQTPVAPEGDISATRDAISRAIGPEAAFIVHSGLFNVVEGPVSPDHIVYSKSYPYQGTLTPVAIDAFRMAKGYLPKVICSPSAIFGVASSLKQATLALELAQDGAFVAQLAEAFGGLQLMTDRARLFIENWEVESYRQKQV